MQTQSDIDMRPPDTDSELAVLISHVPDRIVYVVRSEATWSIHAVNVANGTARRGSKVYDCFLNAARAFRTGAVIWEG